MAGLIGNSFEQGLSKWSNGNHVDKTQTCVVAVVLQVCSQTHQAGIIMGYDVGFLVVPVFLPGFEQLGVGLGLSAEVSVEFNHSTRAGRCAGPFLLWRRVAEARPVK